MLWRLVNGVVFGCTDGPRVIVYPDDDYIEVLDTSERQARWFQSIIRIEQ